MQLHLKRDFTAPVCPVGKPLRDYPGGGHPPRQIHDEHGTVGPRGRAGPEKDRGAGRELSFNRKSQSTEREILMWLAYLR